MKEHGAKYDSKRPGKMHYYISLVKSGVRIAGCIGAVVLQSITLLAVLFTCRNPGILEEVQTKWNIRNGNVLCADGYMMKRKDIPEDGIESGTRWEDITRTGIVHECGVGKDDFDMVEII